MINCSQWEEMRACNSTTQTLSAVHRDIRACMPGVDRPPIGPGRRVPRFPRLTLSSRARACLDCRPIAIFDTYRNVPDSLIGRSIPNPRLPTTSPRARRAAVRHFPGKGFRRDSNVHLPVAIARCLPVTVDAIRWTSSGGTSIINSSSRWTDIAMQDITLLLFTLTWTTSSIRPIRLRPTAWRWDVRNLIIAFARRRELFSIEWFEMTLKSHFYYNYNCDSRFQAPPTSDARARKTPERVECKATTSRPLRLILQTTTTTTIIPSMTTGHINSSIQISISTFVLIIPIKAILRSLKTTTIITNINITTTTNSSSSSSSSSNNSNER